MSPKSKKGKGETALSEEAEALAMNKKLEADLDYMRREFSTIPLKLRSKEPLGTWKRWQRERPNEETIRERWEKWPQAGLAIVTGIVSGLVIIDFDSAEALEAFKRKFPEINYDTVSTVETGVAGHCHLYFRHPGVGVRVKTRAKLFPMVDVKGDGGYAGAPPSIHANGNSYKWNIQLSEKLPEMPTRLLDLVSTREKQANTHGVPEGQRNDALTSIGGGLRRRDIEPPLLNETLQQINTLKCHPPLAEQEVEGIADSILRYPPGPETTEAGNARRFARQHQDEARYCYQWRKWLVWDGTRWRKDDTGEVQRRAKKTAKSLYAEAATAETEDARSALAKHALKSESAYSIKSMLILAQSEKGIAIVPNDLDSYPWLLNVKNGTIDLKTSKLLPHNKELLLTKLVPFEYQPAASCPTWILFLRKIMSGNDAMIEYLQRAIGYAITGDVSEQVFFFLYGTGANGKSTFLNVIQEMMGDYAKQAAPELIVTKRNGSHPTEIADVQGARFVVAVEVEDGRYMAEALVKQMTGGDRIKARFMHQDFFEFSPTHKLFVATNHKLIIRGTDNAIWRRMRLIPFTVTIPDHEQDKRLIEKLRTELPGILTWSVQGSLKWQKEGLGIPAEVKEATDIYRVEMDSLENFLSEKVIRTPDAQTQSSRLYEAYVAWCEATGERRRLNQMKFSIRLKEKAFENKKGAGGLIFWLAIALREEEGQTEWGAA